MKASDHCIDGAEYKFKCQEWEIARLIFIQKSYPIVKKSQIFEFLVIYLAKFPKQGVKETFSALKKEITWISYDLFNKERQYWRTKIIKT